MIPLPLTAVEREAYLQTLVHNHQMRTTVRLTNLAGNVVGDVTDQLLDGQVNIDTTAETSRQCSLTFDDPDHALELDAESPTSGGLYPDRMVQVYYGVRVDSLQRWVDVPVFTGPIATMSRDGSQVQVSALGKEHLAHAVAWRPLTIRKGANTVAAIRTIMRERAGELQFALPELPNARLANAVSLGKLSDPWAVCVNLAKSVGRQVYYDGEGKLRMRTPPATSVHTFREGTLLTEPRVEYDLASVVNAVYVKGGKAKGAKEAATGEAVAPKSHPLSPWSLGRSSVPRYLVEVVENGGITSGAKARLIARNTLNNRLLQGVTVDFDTFPVPHLDPGDVVAVNTSSLSLAFAFSKASIALTHSGVMAVGALRRVRISRGAIR